MTLSTSTISPPRPRTAFSVTDRGYRYEDDELEATFDRGFAVESLMAKRPFEGRRSLARAAEMRVVYEGIVDALPWLL